MVFLLGMPKPNQRFARHSSAFSAADLSVYTFSNQTLRKGWHLFGAVGNTTDGTGPPTVDLAIGGVATTQLLLAGTGSAGYFASLFKYFVPSDGTYSVVLTLNEQLRRAGMTIWDISDGFSGTMYDSATYSGGTSAATTLNCDVPEDGCLVAVATDGDPGAPAPTFTAGVTDWINVDMETTDYLHTGDYYQGNAEVNRAVTLSARTLGGARALVVASFGPAA